jgi:hypothetical protein
MNDDRQLPIPGVPPAPPAAPRVERRRRAVHFCVQVKAERRPVRVTIDAGVVRFRPNGSHTTYDLTLAEWVGLGYWHAAHAAAAAARAERRAARKLREIGGGR